LTSLRTHLGSSKVHNECMYTEYPTNRWITIAGQFMLSNPGMQHTERIDYSIVGTITHHAPRTASHAFSPLSGYSWDSLTTESGAASISIVNILRLPLALTWRGLSFLEIGSMVRQLGAERWELHNIAGGLLQF